MEDNFNEVSLPLPCVVCGKELSSAVPAGPDGVMHSNTPAGGVSFSASGNYGSALFDPMNTRDNLLLTICDDCIVEKANTGSIILRRQKLPITQAPTYRKYFPENASELL